MKIVLISADESKVGMGVRTLSSCLKKHDHNTVIVLMANLESSYVGFEWDSLYELCQDADLVGISFMTHALDKAVDIKTHLSEKFSIPIIVGGIHASIYAKKLLKYFSIVCNGEGEDIIVDLANRMQENKSFDNIPGLLIKKKSIIKINKAKQLKYDINKYPFPDYNLSYQYVIDGNRLVKILPISLHMSVDDFVVLGSRGCPHNCTYCCNKRIKNDFPWRKKVRHYSTGYLIEHLQKIQSKFPEVKSVWIEDDTFFAKSYDEIKEFSLHYKKYINLPFKILISPWTYSPQKVELLINAGMDKLMMGIQTGCEITNNKLYDRNMSNEKLLNITKSLSTYSNLIKYYDFIGMNPFETADNIIETIFFIKSIPKPYYIFFNNLAFYPGTDLYNKAIDAGIDVSKRVKHSEAQIGLRIIIEDNLENKIFHLLLLLIGGAVNKFRYGHIPGFLINAHVVNFLKKINYKYPLFSNKIAIIIACIIYHCNWKKIVKTIFPPKLISTVRHYLNK